MLKPFKLTITFTKKYECPNMTIILFMSWCLFPTIALCVESLFLNCALPSCLGLHSCYLYLALHPFIWPIPSYFPAWSHSDWITFEKKKNQKTIFLSYEDTSSVKSIIRLSFTTFDCSHLYFQYVVSIWLKIRYQSKNQAKKIKTVHAGSLRIRKSVKQPQEGEVGVMGDDSRSINSGKIREVLVCRLRNWTVSWRWQGERDIEI